MSEFDPKKTKQTDGLEPVETAPGATGIFGVVSPQVPASSPGEAMQLPALSSGHESQRPPEAGALSGRATPGAPVVHEVIFQAQDEDQGSETNQPLHRLLQSLPPAHTAPPSPPASGDFTQLLSALQVPDLPATAAAPQKSGFETTEAGGKLAPQPLTAAPEERPEEAASFTRLFEALDSQAVRNPVAKASSEQPPATSPLQGSAQVPPSPATPSVSGARPPAVKDVFEVPVPTPPSREATSFTQLFAALDHAPQPGADQAADYPPIRPAQQISLPSSSRSKDQSLPAKPPMVSLPPLRPEENNDLNSLTQLLQALESLPNAELGRAPLMTPNHADQARSASGATVAFTPPESVQRLAARPAPAPSGPGDFTRILQASALRESGLGSEAAARQHVPERPLAAPAPAPAAGAPIPPWAAPPLPHLPQFPQVAHVNSNVPGIGPIPGFPASHSAFVPTPRSLPGEVQHAAGVGQSRHTILLIVLLGIIVVLLAVLVAVLLRR